MDTSDRHILEEYRKGDEDAFGTLVTRHAPGIYSFVFRLVRNADDARDITQEAFIKLWRHRKRYDPSQDFRAWAFSIARNTALDTLRKRRSYAFADLEGESGEGIAESLPDPLPLPDELFENARARLALEEALGKLPLSYRTAILLKQEGLTFEQMGIALKQSPNTVKSRYRRGLALLREIMHQNGSI